MIPISKKYENIQISEMEAIRITTLLRTFFDDDESTTLGQLRDRMSTDGLTTLYEVWRRLQSKILWEDNS